MVPYRDTEQPLKSIHISHSCMQYMHKTTWFTVLANGATANLPFHGWVETIVVFVDTHEFP